MEPLIQMLETGDIKTRMVASEQFYNKLRQKSSIDNLEVFCKTLLLLWVSSFFHMSKKSSWMRALFSEYAQQLS